MRGHGVHLGPETPYLRFRGALVHGVRVGMQEADRDRLHAVGTEGLDDRRERSKVQGPHFRASVVHPPRQFAAQISRNEGLRFLIVKVEEVGPIAAGDFQCVPESLRRDQSDLRALALGEGVDHDGRAVRQKVDLGKQHAALLQHVEDAAFEVRRGGRCLFRGHMRLAGLGIDVESNQVRERSADVDRDAGDPVAHGRSPVLLFRIRSRKASSSSVITGDTAMRLRV